MFKDKFYIQYSGFNPSCGERQYLESVFRELYEEAPYGANLSAIVSARSRDDLKVIVQIAFGGGKFFASANSKSLNQATKKVLSQLRKQFSKWREKRFIHMKKTIRHKSFENGVA